MADETRSTAVIKMGTVGDESMKRLNTHVASIIMTLMSAVWNPNAVPLK